MNSTGSTRIFILFFLVCNLFWTVVADAQTTGSISGKVFDKDTKELLTGASVTLVGTYSGAYVDDAGKFSISNIKPGEYTLRCYIIGYAEKFINGVKIEAGQTKEMVIEMINAETTLGTVIIEGERNMVDLESGQSTVKITSEDLKDMNTRDIQSVAALQAGVNKTPDGLQIRGGRVYETSYLIEGINAADPLAGTGFGTDVNTGSVQDIEVITGGADAEYGDGTSGVILTRIKEGTNKFSVSANYLRDNFGFNKNQGMHWNTDIFNAALSGPVLKDKLHFFVSTSMELNDEFPNVTANQLHSSLLENDSIWAPRQDNKWSGTAKLSWNISSGTKLNFTLQNSLNINQNTRSLQIIGNDQIMTPGFQYAFSQNMDNANTYTHRSNLMVANFIKIFNERWTFDVSAGRLFVNLRADANGRPFRTETVDQLFDPYSIVSDPVTLFNGTDSVIYVNPGPGLINNGGIATLWHDHYAQEYTLKYKFSYFPKNKIHKLTFGHEHKEQEYQWIDVTRPWVGAPIVVNDTLTTPSTSIGQTNDVWKVNPATGGFFFSDDIRYKGIIANLGLRMMYWAPGKFADDAVANPEAPVLDQTRQEYLDQTSAFLGRRWKGRLLPKIRVSFPVTENNVLYFNYGHATRLPHPRFLYAGLDPVYQNRSFLANLGNPNLNPEVTVSYEVGLKSQITSNFSLTVAAFYNDKYDYIVSRSVLVKDQTGRFVTKTFYINQDYARIRGLEISLGRRFGKWLKVNFNGSYQIATGKSNTAAESALQIAQQGFVSASKEQYLAWDRPFDFKLAFIVKPDSTFRIFTIPFKNLRIFVTSTWKSGLRYTPQTYIGDDPLTGRPLYESVVNEPFSKLGSPWFWTDLKVTKDYYISKNRSISWSFELRNLFDNLNAAIVNPVTGKGYQAGDPLPSGYRDPMYPDPRDNGVPPNNPARWLEPRHMLIGLSVQF